MRAQGLPFAENKRAHEQLTKDDALAIVSHTLNILSYTLTFGHVSNFKIQIKDKKQQHICGVRVISLYPTKGSLPLRQAVTSRFLASPGAFPSTQKRANTLWMERIRRRTEIAYPQQILTVFHPSQLGKDACPSTPVLPVAARVGNQRTYN